MRLNCAEQEALAAERQTRRQEGGRRGKLHPLLEEEANGAILRMVWRRRHRFVLTRMPTFQPMFGRKQQPKH